MAAQGNADLFGVSRGARVHGEGAQPCTGRPGRTAPDQQAQQDCAAQLVPPFSTTQVVENEGKRKPRFSLSVLIIARMALISVYLGKGGGGKRTAPAPANAG